MGRMTTLAVLLCLATSPEATDKTVSDKVANAPASEELPPASDEIDYDAETPPITNWDRERHSQGFGSEFGEESIGAATYGWGRIPRDRKGRGLAAVRSFEESAGGRHSATGEWPATSPSCRPRKRSALR